MHQMTCRSCHDPHRPLEHDMAYYDSKCLSCHISRPETETRNHPGRACPVSDRNCVNCHMPKYKLPGSDFQFTDHWIRVVRPGEPYPS